MRRKVKARITRVVEEVAIVFLDSDGEVEEVDEVLEEIDCDDIQIINVIARIN